MIRKKAAIALALCGLMMLASSLSACHTTAGAGEDISDTGKTIEHSAKEHTPN